MIKVLDPSLKSPELPQQTVVVIRHWEYNSQLVSTGTKPTSTSVYTTLY